MVSKDMKTVTLGLDPEFFLYKGAATNIIPACGLIGGTKQKPLDIGQGVRIQEDGVAVEYGMDPIEHTYGATKFLSEALRGMNVVSRFVRSKNKDYGLSSRAYWNFKPEALQDRRACEFGCDPDFNAYQQGMPYAPVEVEKFPTERCTGGHIHVGYDKASCEIPDWALVQLAEAFSTYFYIGRYSQEYIGAGRNKMYGRPGAFRPKPYGFEYRTPSSRWATDAENLPGRIGDVVLWAINNPIDARTVYDRLPFMGIYDELSVLSAGSTNLAVVDNLYKDIIKPIISKDKEPKITTGPRIFFNEVQDVNFADIARRMNVGNGR